MFNKIKKIFKKNTLSDEFNYDPWQQEVLEKSKGLPVNVSIFSNPKLKCYEMEAARDALLDGASPSFVSDIILAYTNNEITQKQYENLMEKSIYMVDIPYLTGKYNIYESPLEKPKYGLLDVIYGTILGDISGSKYEFSYDVESRIGLNMDNCFDVGSQFTDDSVLSCATYHVLKTDSVEICLDSVPVTEIKMESTYPFINNPFVLGYRKFAHKFPTAGYGPGFIYWAANDEDKPYGSLGNGSAMRVGPVGAYFEKLEDVILYAIASAAATHNHPEGIKGAIVIAVSIWMAKHGYSKEQIYNYMCKHYKYNKYDFKDFSIEEIKNPTSVRRSDATCMFAVPAAIICFYNTNSYEECINEILSFAGDTDTIAAIAGGLAAVYYGFSRDKKQILKKYGSTELLDEIGLKI